jgi:hypothetical protein
VHHQVGVVNCLAQPAGVVATAESTLRIQLASDTLRATKVCSNSAILKHTQLPAHNHQQVTLEDQNYTSVKTHLLWQPKAPPCPLT